MTKADIVNEIAQKTGREKKAVTECVEAFMETVTEELSRGGRIELRDFGNFMVKERAAKVGRNPATGKVINIVARKMPVFKPSKSLNDKVQN